MALKEKAGIRHLLLHLQPVFAELKHIFLNP